MISQAWTRKGSVGGGEGEGTWGEVMLTDAIGHLPFLQRCLRPDLYILRLSTVHRWLGGPGTRPMASSLRD